MNTVTKKFKATDLHTDFEVRSQNSMCVNRSELDKPLLSNFKFAIAGILLGLY